MEFEWDEDKRLSNLEKHGIDFLRASTIWEGAPLDPYAQNWIGNEQRRVAIGGLPDAEGEKIVAVVIFSERAACVSSARGQRGAMSEKTTEDRSNERVAEDRTDWTRLRTMTDEQNEANIARDFDSWPLHDQARGYFFHVRPAGNGRWTWDMVDRDNRIAARAPEDYESWEAAEAATLTLRESLKAA